MGSEPEGGELTPSFPRFELRIRLLGAGSVVFERDPLKGVVWIDVSTRYAGKSDQHAVAGVEPAELLAVLKALELDKEP